MQVNTNKQNGAKPPVKQVFRSSNARKNYPVSVVKHFDRREIGQRLNQTSMPEVTLESDLKEDTPIQRSIKHFFESGKFRSFPQGNVEECNLKKQKKASSDLGSDPNMLHKNEKSHCSLKSGSSADLESKKKLNVPLTFHRFISRLGKDDPQEVEANLEVAMLKQEIAASKVSSPLTSVSLNAFEKNVKELKVEVEKLRHNKYNSQLEHVTCLKDEIASYRSDFWGRNGQDQTGDKENKICEQTKRFEGDELRYQEHAVFVCTNFENGTAKVQKIREQGDFGVQVVMDCGSLVQDSSDWEEGPNPESNPAQTPIDSKIQEANCLIDKVKDTLRDIKGSTCKAMRSIQEHCQQEIHNRPPTRRSKRSTSCKCKVPVVNQEEPFVSPRDIVKLKTIMEQSEAHSLAENKVVPTKSSVQTQVNPQTYNVGTQVEVQLKTTGVDAFDIDMVEMLDKECQVTEDSSFLKYNAVELGREISSSEKFYNKTEEIESADSEPTVLYKSREVSAMGHSDIVVQNTSREIETIETPIIETPIIETPIIETPIIEIPIIEILPVVVSENKESVTKVTDKLERLKVQVLPPIDIRTSLVLTTTLNLSIDEEGISTNHLSEVEGNIVYKEIKQHETIFEGMPNTYLSEKDITLMNVESIPDTKPSNEQINRKNSFTELPTLPYSVSEIQEEKNEVEEVPSWQDDENQNKKTEKPQVEVKPVEKRASIRVPSEEFYQISESSPKIEEQKNDGSLDEGDMMYSGVVLNQKYWKDVGEATIEYIDLEGQEDPSRHDLLEEQPSQLSQTNHMSYLESKQQFIEEFSQKKEGEKGSVELAWKAYKLGFIKSNSTQFDEAESQNVADITKSDTTRNEEEVNKINLEEASVDSIPSQASITIRKSKYTTSSRDSNIPGNLETSQITLKKSINFGKVSNIFDECFASSSSENKANQPKTSAVESGDSFNTSEEALSEDIKQMSSNYINENFMKKVTYLHSKENNSQKIEIPKSPEKKIIDPKTDQLKKQIEKLTISKKTHELTSNESSLEQVTDHKTSKDPYKDLFKTQAEENGAKMADPNNFKSEEEESKRTQSGYSKSSRKSKEEFPKGQKIDRIINQVHLKAEEWCKQFDTETESKSENPSVHNIKKKAVFPGDAGRGMEIVPNDFESPAIRKQGERTRSKIKRTVRLDRRNSDPSESDQVSISEGEVFCENLSLSSGEIHACLRSKDDRKLGKKELDKSKNIDNRARIHGHKQYFNNWITYYMKNRKKEMGEI